MKNPLKIFAGVCCGVCLAAMTFFINQNAAPAYANSEEASIKTEAKPETRCGWFINPTPANAELSDRDGVWTIGEQSGFQAEGDYPAFGPKQWVETNGHYGYGCACMNVTTDKAAQKILVIKSSTPRPLSACRKDKKLKEPR